MAEEKKPIVATRCPKCGQVVRFYSPGQTGLVKVRCTNGSCAHVFGVRLTEREIAVGSKAQNGNIASPQSSMESNSESHPPTDPIVNTGGTPSGSIARLMQKRRLFFKKDKYYGLHIGANTVGMYDTMSTSDIMIEGDPTISHRSVTINVEVMGSTYKYLLTVARATNPVLLSGKVLPIGTSVYMQLGQELVLGKTHLYLTNE